MFRRLAKLSDTNSFFLFGARGTGKTSLLREHFPQLAPSEPGKTNSEVGVDSSVPYLWIDLLEARQERLFQDDPIDCRRC